MAANYWNSTQCQYWYFAPEKLADHRDELTKAHARVVEQYPYPDRRLMFVFMRDRLIQLSKHLPSRQQCVATALTYLQRYFLFTPMQNVNIYLLVATAFYLASKTEEAPHHIRLVASEARQKWPEFIPADVARLGEMEFCLISEMHSQLIIWHPYRSLMALKESQDLSLTQEELQLAWSIVNDTYMTDLPLTCPPYLIAVTAMFLAIIFQPNKSALSFNNLTSQDVSTTRDSSNSSAHNSLGGRSGIASAFGSAVGGLSSTNTQSQNHNSVGGQKTNFNPTHLSAQPQTSTAANQNTNATNTAQTDSETIKAKTISLALSSEKMQRVIKFLVDSDIDVERMITATQEIISLYEIWEASFNEKAIKEAVARCLKSRGLDG